MFSPIKQSAFLRSSDLLTFKPSAVIILIGYTTIRDSLLCHHERRRLIAYLSDFYSLTLVPHDKQLV
jgi:hypothetical protein